MKKTLLIVLILLFSTVPLVLFAETGIDPEQESSVQEDYSEIISAHCLCGRDYYTGEEDGHSAFDCKKCGQNMYVCTCNCWCGAATVLDTSGNYGSIIPRICTGCNKPCILCDCRSDREAILFAEQQRRTGEISSLNILRPKSALIPVTAILVTGLLVALCVLADRKGLFEKLISRVPYAASEDEENNAETDRKPDKKDIITEDGTKPLADRKPAISSADVKTGGVYRLYRTVALLDANKAEKKAYLHYDEPDLTFSAEEITAIISATRTEPSELSPFVKNSSDTIGDTLSDLILEGIIIKQDDGFKIEENLGKYISDISAPKTTISFETVFSGRYTFCSAGTEWYSVNGKDTIQIRVFSDINSLCDWISDVFDDSKDEKNIPQADFLFDYEEFSFYALTQILGVSDSFTEEDVLRPDVCAKIKNSLRSERFFLTAKTFEDLSIEEEIEKTIDIMEKKGLLFDNNGHFACSRTVNAVLGNDQIRECVHLSKRGSADFEILFAIRENGAAAIYDTGSEVRIMSAEQIPWRQYIG